MAGLRAATKLSEAKFERPVAKNELSELPSKEILNLKQHYESELDLARKERQELIVRCQELS